MRRTSLAATLCALVVTAGCVHSPVRSSEMEAQLKWLDAHGYTDSDVDKPKIPALAVVLDILPIPGCGHYYVGDVGDGLKTSFLFWLIVPWIRGPIDAYKEASYMNDVAYIEYAEKHGWFEKRDKPREKPAPEPTAARKDPAPSTTKEAAAPTQPAKETLKETKLPADPHASEAKAPAGKHPCSGCGIEYEGTTCPTCGTTEVQKAVFCKNCGEKFEGNFCTKCGVKR